MAKDHKIKGGVYLFKIAIANSDLIKKRKKVKKPHIDRVKYERLEIAC